MKKLFSIFTVITSLNIFALYLHGIEVQATENKINKTVDVSKNQDTYILDSGDVLKLIVFDSEDLSGIVTILNDGTISLPLITSINLRGLNINQAKEEITKAFSKELINPQISLEIKETRPLRISIIGEVQKPGLYVFNKENNLSSIDKSIEFPTLVDAIKKAGGITKNSDISNVKITRKSINYESKYLDSNINDLLINGNQDNNPFLFDGDIIEIGYIERNSKLNYKLLNSNLSPNRINVFIVGEVNNPGLIQLNPNSTLSQSIFAAGGPKYWRSNNKVDILRISSAGKTTTKSIKMNYKKGISKNKNPILKENDVIRVYRSGLAKSSDTLNSIADPASKIISIWSLIKLVND